MMYATYGQQKPATKPLNLGVPHLEFAAGLGNPHKRESLGRSGEIQVETLK